MSEDRNPDGTTAITATSAGQDQAKPVGEPVEPPVKDGIKLFSQDEVNRILQDRLAREREKTATPTEPKAKPTEDVGLLLNRLQEMETLRRFDYAVSGMPLSAERRGALEKLFLMEKPDSPTEWAIQKANVFGWVDQPKDETKAVPVPAGPSVTATTAPTPDRVSYTEADDSLKWSADTVERVKAEKGIKYLVERFERDMANRRIVRGGT